MRGAYRVDRRGTVRIELESYDRARPLVVDPVLTASRFLGGGTQDPNVPPEEEGANGIALDSAGNVYVAGSTSVDNFPTFPRRIPAVSTAPPARTSGTAAGGRTPS